MSKSKYHPMGFDVRLNDGREIEIFASGRNRFGLEQLIKAGGTGITADQFAGVRVAAFVFNLRDMGIEIKSITEQHGGIFAGTHSRYHLDCFVQPKGGRLL